MAKSKGPNKKRNAYQHQPSSVCITLWSQDGAPVSDSVINEAQNSIAYLAKGHNLLMAAVRA